MASLSWEFLGLKIPTSVAGPAHLHEGMRAAAWEYHFGIFWAWKMLKIVLPWLGLLTSKRAAAWEYHFGSPWA